MQRSAGQGESVEVIDVVPMLGAPLNLAVTTSTARQQLSAGVRRVSVVAIGCDMAFKLGGGSVVAAATDHVLLQGERIEFAVRPAETYVAAIALSGSGTLRITELADA